MKTNLLRVGTSFLMILMTACAFSAYADDGTAAKDRTYSGTVSAVNVNTKMITVHGWFLTRQFVLGDNCMLSAGGKKDAALTDFRPGQKVDVSYQDASGVLVASRVLQEKLTFQGEVTAIDQNNHTVTVRRGGTSKTFALADNCNVLLAGNNKGTAEDVKIGDRVAVTYETPQNELLARMIEEKSATYTGALSAINLPDRTVSADKRFLGDKRFHLADNCAIITDGRLGGRLSDLRLGRNYEFSYNTVDGVNIVNRIAPVASADKAEAANAAPQMKDY